MDNKKFLEWLTLLTHWQYPRTDEKGFNPNGGYNKAQLKKQIEKRLATAEEIEEDELEDEDMPFVRNGYNLTRSPQVLAIKHEAKPCEDCGIIVQGRVIEQKIYTTGGAHWRRRCSHCNKIQNPDTGKFDIPSHLAHTYFKDKISRRNK